MPAEQSSEERTTEERQHHPSNWWTIVFFVAATVLPLLAGLIEGDSEISATEKRFLTKRPALEASWHSLASFPRRMEKYYDDRLGFREALIRSYAYLKIELFGTSPSESLVIGKQGWLFFGDPDAVANYRGVASLGPAKLGRWQQLLEKRRDWLAEQGIEFLLVLVPDKHLMYPEYMPDRLPRTGNAHPLDQLSRHLTRHSDVNVLDLRGALEETKKTERTHHRTDSHWNEVGAYAAYRAILERLGESVPALANATPIPVVRKSSITPGLGLANIVGLGGIYREELLQMTPRNPHAVVKLEHRAKYDERVRKLLPIALGVENRELPRAVMFRDSFANALIPYLSENFQRILYVWDRDVNPRIVSIEKPDVVILEIVGRFLGRVPRARQDAAKPKRR